MLPEDVRARDQDTGINAPVFYRWAGSGPDYRHFQLNRNTGTIYLAGPLGPQELSQPRTREERSLASLRADHGCSWARQGAWQRRAGAAAAAQ